MAEAVTVAPGTRTLVGPGWELRAEWVHDSGMEWRALIGIRRGLKLLVTGDRAAGLLVEAWAGEPEESDGVAVIEAGAGTLRLAPVPLCGCGDRGCGNAGIQLSKQLLASDLPALMALLRDLPWSETIPTRSNVLRGPGLAAIAAPRPWP
jgi:hypothetical protein